MDEHLAAGPAPDGPGAPGALLREERPDGDRPDGVQPHGDRPHGVRRDGDPGVAPTRFLRRPIVLSALAVALAVPVGLLAARATAPGRAGVEVSGSGSAYRGQELPVLRHLPDVPLTDTSGRAFDPAAHDDHPVTLLFTGYTRCPDICPTTMADVASALRALTPARRAAVQVEFVSTDPEHDSPARVRAWLDRFDPAFIGLRGTSAQVADLSLALGMPAPDDDGTTHSAELLAFEQGRGASVVYLSDLTPGDLVADLPRLIAAAGAGG